MSSGELDAEITKLRAQASVRAGGSDAGYGWERARERRDREGSYRELERALEKLNPTLRHVITVVYDSGLVKQVRGSYADAEAKAIAELANLMPRKIRVPRREYPEIREMQVRWIKSLTGSIHEIAKTVGRSKRFVASVR